MMEKVLMLNEKSVVDDRSKMQSEKRMLEDFMTSYLGRKKILVIRVSGFEKAVVEEIEAFAEKTERGFILLDGQTLTPERVREAGERKEEPLLVAVKNLSQLRNMNTAEEAAVFRALMDMADPGNEELGFHEDSSLVFLAEENFPSQEMASISLTWAYESVFLDCRDLVKMLSIREENMIIFCRRSIMS